MKKILFSCVEICSGAGGQSLGLEKAGCKCIFSSEIDKFACDTYEKNFGERPAGDITKISAEKIPDFEILCAGFPCQSFSIIGKQEGFENETCGTLFFEIERILKFKKPKAFLLENVKNLKSHDGGKTFQIICEHLQKIGYNVHAKILNSLDFGLPQKRERIFIVGFLENIFFEFPQPVAKENSLTLEDILEKNVDKKYFVREEIKNSRLARLKNKNYPRPYISHENISGSITPHPYSSALRAGASANYILINDERRPTEREMLRLQGFPENFQINLPYGQVKKLCGNSVSIPVVKAIAEKMISALEENNL